MSFTTQPSSQHATNISRPAFVDKSGIRWDTNSSEYEGWLTKKSKWLGSWRRRYFVLKGAKLFYGESPTDSPHGIIDLIDCKSVAKTSDPKAKKNFGFDICYKHDEFICINADNERDKTEWAGRLDRSIKKYSSNNIPPLD